MAFNWNRLILPTLLALALSLAAVSTASASGDHPVGVALGASHLPAQEGDNGDTTDDGAGDGTTDDGTTDDGATDDGDNDAGDGNAFGRKRLVASLAPVEFPVECEAPEASTFNPSLSVLCAKYDRVAPQARVAMARVIAAHAQQIAPGWARRFTDAEVNPARLRRFAARAGDDAVERFERAGLLRQARTDAGGARSKARKVVARKVRDGDVRDGDVRDGDVRDGDIDPIAVCRRLANSDQVSDHPELAQRCRDALDGGLDGDAVTSPLALCRRLRDSGGVDEHEQLAARCRDLIAGDGDGGDQQRIRRTNTDRPAIARTGGDRDGIDRDAADGDGVAVDRDRPALRRLKPQRATPQRLAPRSARPDFR